MRDEAMKLALEAKIHNAGMNPIMQGGCYLMHPEAMQKVIDAAIREALAEQPAPAITPEQLLALAQTASFGLDEVIEAFKMAAPVQQSTEAQVEAARADERDSVAKLTEDFARKWWKIHCDSNLHYSSTLKAHQDFCALQAAIRARIQE